MKKSQINYKEIDSGIRDLVGLLNEIPFVATESSCEGHLRPSVFVFSKQPTSQRTAHGEKVFADSGYGFIDGGHIMLRCDRKNRHAKTFLNDLEELAKKYDFFSIYARQSRQARYYFLRTDTPATPEITANLVADIPFDVRKTKAKQICQVKLAEGQKRLKEFEKAWNDVREIAKKYIPSRK